MFWGPNTPTGHCKQMIHVELIGLLLMRLRKCKKKDSPESVQCTRGSGSWCERMPTHLSTGLLEQRSGFRGFQADTMARAKIRHLRKGFWFALSFGCMSARMKRVSEHRFSQVSKSHATYNKIPDDLHATNINTPPPKITPLVQLIRPVYVTCLGHQGLA